MLLDLGNVLVNLYKFWKQDAETQAWVKLLLSTGFSAFIALTGATGSALVAKQPAPIAVGMGLIACAVSVLSVLLRAPQGRSLMLSVPQGVVKQYQAPEGQTIIEPTKK